MLLCNTVFLPKLKLWHENLETHAFVKEIKIDNDSWHTSTVHMNWESSRHLSIN